MSNFENYRLVTVSGVEHCVMDHDATTYIKFDDIKEFLKSTANSRYMTAREVWLDYTVYKTDSPNGLTFKAWLLERLND